MKMRKSEDRDGELSLRSLLREGEKESVLILITIPLILLFWVYFGKQADFERLFQGFADRTNRDFYSAVYEYTTAFLLMFWVPFLIIRMHFKRPLSDFGIQKGDARYGIRFVIFLIPFALWAAWIGSSMAEVQAEYPLAKSSMERPLQFFVMECLYLTFYFGWEFFFRGFILFGLERRFGALGAILIQTIPSAIVHIGKPAGESFGAILAGLLFGYLAVRTRSIYYPLLLHAILGIATDIFVTLRVL
ncbi:MAG TPA: CPBP family intramembrane metalloprotease [bacterium]|nr:CPBP family intramembrane metalloprotease [bacterium]